MSTLALNPTPTARPRRHTVAASLALPLGLMTALGVIIFWTWTASSLLFCVLGFGMAYGFVAGAVKTLRKDASGLRLLRLAAATQVLFTLAKLVFWSETEASLFGLTALAILALTRR